MIYKCTIFILLLAASALSLSAYDTATLQRILSLSPEQLKIEVNDLKKEAKERKSDPEYHLTLGLLYYMQASQGKKTSGKAIKHFEAYLKVNNDVLIKSYLGSCYTMYGGDTSNMAYVTEGLSLIDQTCVDQPDNFFVRMNRVNTGLGSPNFLYYKRKELVNSDIEHLLKLFDQQKLTKQQHGETLLAKSFILIKERKKDEALKLLKKITRIYPDFAEAREMLKELK